MGCDIHFYLEESFKQQPPKEWFPIGNFSLDRDYALFGVLAGVREGSALFEPRGVPEDMSYQAADDYYEDDDETIPDSDWHTPSWLTYKELKKVYAEYCLRVPDWKHRDMEAVLAMLRVYDRFGAETRAVFWFDN